MGSAGAGEAGAAFDSARSLKVVLANWTRAAAFVVEFQEGSKAQWHFGVHFGSVTLRLIIAVLC